MPNFSLNTFHHFIRNSPENMLYGAANLEFKTKREVFYCVCTLGIYAAYKAFKSESKVKAAAEFALKVMIEYCNSSPSNAIEIQMASGDNIILTEKKDGSDCQESRVFIKVGENGEDVELCKSTLPELIERLREDYNKNKILYEKFSDLNVREGFLLLYESGPINQFDFFLPAASSYKNNSNLSPCLGVSPSDLLLNLANEEQ